KMKLSLLSALSLSLLLFDAHFSLGKKSGKTSSSKTSTSSNHGKTQTSTKTDSRNNQGSVSVGEFPKQHGPLGQGGSSPGGGGYGHGGHRHRAYGRGGYGPYDGGSDVGGFGSYGVGDINQNRILSPHYGNSLGYGGRGGRGGSPFYQKVKAVGISPSDKSRGFGRTAVMAASGGVVAKMAVDYGLGRVPHRQFQFQSPEEEYYYNYYMYTIYGVKSTDANDYSRDYAYSQPLEDYERHMNTCMKTVELLPEDDQQISNKPALNVSTSVLSVLSVSNDTDNKTAADNSSSSPAPNHPGKTEAKPVSPTSQIPSGAAATAALDRDDDTVSIVEIGYPALIRMMKVRKCLKIYIVNSEKYLKVIGGAQRLETGRQMVVAVIPSALLMLMNSNMLQ
uniref:Prion protein, related sequence 3 n=1 Tax=Tetraodon nigroviridis TaxID=99883 RepID=H3C1J5_TETNG